MYQNDYNFYELSPMTDPEDQHKNTKKHNKKTFFKKAGILVLSGILLGGSAGLTFQAVTGNSKAQQKTSGQNTTGQNINTLKTTSAADDGSVASQSLDVSDIASSVMPSIVSITNKSVQEVQNYYDLFGMGGMGGTQEVESAGSGIIIGQNDSELLIVTNHHVVADASTLTAGFIDGSASEAKIKGTDPARDLAVIAVPLETISEDTMSQIQIIETGDSENLKVGEQVVAIGNALGYGQSVTTGIISALDRSLDDGSDSDATFIQTDAAINPGNSGGALLNMQGQLVGINSAKLASTEVEGMGYAIPLNDAQPILENLMNRTTRERVSEGQQASLGISGADVNAQATEIYGMPSGVYVSEVTKGSAADKAGIQSGSIITKFDGQSVSSITELKDQLTYYAAGETISVTVSYPDNGRYEEQNVSVTLDTAETEQNS